MERIAQPDQTVERANRVVTPTARGTQADGMFDLGRGRIGIEQQMITWSMPVGIRRL